LCRVIVVDDASGDDTGERIAQIGDSRILYHQRAENGGIGAARRDSFNLSEADWTVQLDSDHELLPGAIEEFANLAAIASKDVGILGARFLWENNTVTPICVPNEPIDYMGRIRWCNRPDGIGSDYLCCISRRLRDKVKWSPYRSMMTDALFHLDAAKEAKALFSTKCLALQKLNAPAGHTRGSASDRFRRRKMDAIDGVRACEEIINKHGSALMKEGKVFFSGILQSGAMFALLLGDRVKSLKWAIAAVRLGGVSIDRIGLIAGILGGPRFFEWLYRFRG